MISCEHSNLQDIIRGKYELTTNTLVHIYNRLEIYCLNFVGNPMIKNEKY